MAIKQLNQLTARKVATAKDGWHSDGGGLYLRVSDNRQRRRWVFVVTRAGKRTEIGLGSANAVTLTKARDERKRLADMVSAGLNPLTERHRIQAVEAGRKTFAEVANIVIENRRKGIVASSLDAWTYSLFVDAKRLVDLDVATIAVDDVKQAVMPMFERGHHESARRTLSRIEAVLAYAIVHGWRTAANVAMWKKMWEVIAPMREKADRRHRALEWRDAPRVFAKLRKIEMMRARCLEFLALTGMRLTAVTGTQWNEINFKEATWAVPGVRMKRRGEAVGKPHVVPLSKQALDLLTALKTHRSGPFVFFGQDVRHPISGRAVQDQCDRVTARSASPHGWRTTFRSWCGAHGVDREVAEAAIAHKAKGVEGVYQRDAMVERRKPVMQAWADYCDGKSAEETNVVRIAVRR